MQRLVFSAIILALGTGVTFAQDFTAEQRAACKADYDKFCQGTLPGGGRVLACLSKQHDQLSDACKKVVDAQRK